MRGPTSTPTIALVGALVLAGCVGIGQADSAPNASNVSGGPTAAPAEFDETTGGIEGVVHDEDLAPIAGAQVAVKDTNFTGVTDGAGSFSFSHAAAGTYQLFAASLGYTSAGKSIVVEAGKVSRVDVTLTKMPVVEAYSTTKEQRGMFGCGLTVKPVVGVSVCGVFSLVLNNTDYDHFLLNWHLSGKPVEWKGGVLEMKWQSNQLLGNTLSLIWEVNGCPNDRKETFGTKSGASPIRIQVNATTINQTMLNASKSDGCSGAKDQCDNDSKCVMQTRVFSAAGTTGQAADVGFTFQQQFNQYETEFFGSEAPENWTALPDG